MHLKLNIFVRHNQCIFLSSKPIILLVLLFCCGVLSAQDVHTEEKRQGAYKSYKAFLYNDPDITDSIGIKFKKRKQENWEGIDEAIPVYSASGKKVKDIWGFTASGKSYIFHLGTFFELFKEGEHYAFIGYEITEGSQVGFATAAGGLITGGIHAINVTAYAKSKRVKYFLHKATGAVMYASKPYLASEAAEKSKLVLYRRYRGESERVLEFSVNDSLQYRFERDAYVILYFDPSVEKVEVCSGDGSGRCREIRLVHKGKKYLECSLGKRKDKAKFLEVRESKGEFDSDSAERDQKRRLVAY